MKSARATKSFEIKEHLVRSKTKFELKDWCIGEAENAT